MAVCVSFSLAAGLPVGPNANSLRAKRVVVCGVTQSEGSNSIPDFLPLVSLYLVTYCNSDASMATLDRVWTSKGLCGSKKSEQRS